MKNQDDFYWDLDIIMDELKAALSQPHTIEMMNCVGEFIPTSNIER